MNGELDSPGSRHNFGQADGFDNIVYPLDRAGLMNNMNLPHKQDH